MKYNKNLSALAIVFAFLGGLALGYVLRTESIPVSKPLNLQNDETAAKKNSGGSIEREKAQTDLTANEALRLADQDALSWSKDSFISEISLFSKKFTAEGRSNGWKLVYYSKTKDKLYEVVIKDGESRGGEEKEVEKAPKTLKGELADSSLLAKTFFMNYPEDSEITGLKMYYDTGAKKFMWIIIFDKGSYALDAEI